MKKRNDKTQEVDVFQQLRLTILNERKNIRNHIVVYLLKINLPAIAIATVFALSFHYLPNYFLSKTLLVLSASSLSNLSVGISASAAAVLTILVAFIAFWFGNSQNRMEYTHRLIKEELRNLEVIRNELAPYTAKPKEDAPEPAKSKVKDLAKKTETFDAAIRRMLSRFTRAELGTFYDLVELVDLHTSIDATGGEWFESHWNLITDFNDRQFSRKIWINTMSSADRLIGLNRDVKRGYNQIIQILDFIPSLISILFIFVSSLTVIFLANTVLTETSILANISLSFILIILLSIHMAIIVRYIWRLISSEIATFRANRLIDTQYTTQVEQKYVVDDKEARLRWAKRYIELFTNKEKGKESKS